MSNVTCRSSASEAAGAPRPALSRHLWLGAGLLMLALGIIGALLPVMPTTIFLILAVGCFGRSSPALEAKLLAHPRYGRSLRAWRQEGAISARGKRLATMGIGLGLVLFWWGAKPSPVWGMPVSAAMAACAGWLLVRPLPRGDRPGPVADWLQRHPREVAAASSVAAHVLLLWLVLGGWPVATVPPAPHEPVRIQLTLLPPAAPPVPVAPREAPRPVPDATASPPPPRQHQAAAPTEAPAMPTIPPLEPAALPEPASGRDRPVYAEPMAEASLPSQAASPASPSLPSAPVPAGARDPNWEGEVLARLEKFRRYPRPARVRRQQGVVYVHALVDRQGGVLSAQVRRGSGHPVLDREALDTFLRAQPLPAPPAALPTPVELEVPVEFFLR